MILVGQSNKSGWGRLSEGDDPRILVWVEGREEEDREKWRGILCTTITLRINWESKLSGLAEASSVEGIYLRVRFFSTRCEMLFRFLSRLFPPRLSRACREASTHGARKCAVLGMQVNIEYRLLIIKPEI